MLQAILPAVAARHGPKVALVTGSRSLTYEQLDDLSDGFAGALKMRGIESGDRVSIYRKTAGSGSSPTTASAKPARW